MKKITFFSYLMVIFLAAGLNACDKMTDNYQKYVENGEIVYLVKPDSVTSYPGNNRVLIDCILRNAYNVDKIWVYWNDGQDSASFDYTQATEIDSLAIMITGLEEKSYIFDLYTKNSDGSRSIKVTTFATAYGERYRTSLYPRIISGFSCDTLNATLSWLASDETEDVTEVKYTTIDGIQNVVSLSTDTSKLLLSQFSDLGAISYRSFYKPEPAAIDSFATDWVTYPLPPAYAVYKSITMTPKTGGASVEFDNPQNIIVSVKIQYLSNSGVLTTKVFKVSPGTISGLNTNPRDFKVTLIDGSGNTFGPKIFNITPL